MNRLKLGRCTVGLDRPTYFIADISSVVSSYTPLSSASSASKAGKIFFTCSLFILSIFFCYPKNDQKEECKKYFFAGICIWSND